MKFCKVVFFSSFLSVSLGLTNVDGIVTEKPTISNKQDAIGNIKGIKSEEMINSRAIDMPAIEKKSEDVNVNRVDGNDDIEAIGVVSGSNAISNAKTASGSISDTNSGSADDQPEETSYNSFLMAISMIIVSEIGDKTFLIAALMAMKNSRLVVFSAAFSSLAIMTVLSGIVGHVLPTLISQRLTQFLAAILFVVFGYRLLMEGLAMSKNMGVDEELAEVEQEIASSNINSQMSEIESGHAGSFTPKSSTKQWYVEAGEHIKNLAAFVLSPLFIQVFIMTFLGEWGDRSQIATIAMAAGSEYWFVILGAIVGHGVCTAAACIGGKLLAKRISMRNITLGGAIAFFIFSMMYFYNAYYNIQ